MHTKQTDRPANRRCGFHCGQHPRRHLHSKNKAPHFLCAVHYYQRLPNPQIEFYWVLLARIHSTGSSLFFLGAAQLYWFVARFQLI